MTYRLAIAILWGCVLPTLAGAQTWHGGHPADTSRLSVGVAAQLSYNRDRPSPMLTAGWWEGRGLNRRVQLDARYQTPVLRLRLAPEWQSSRNDTLVASPLGTSPFQYPMREGTIDLPPRFGDKSFSRWDAGRTEIALRPRGMEVALSHAPPAVGGGRWMGLLSGRGAPGFWHLRVGTATPMSFRGAQVSGYVMAGRLTNSDFALDSPGASRPLYRAAVEVAPFPHEPGLRLHAASAVIWNRRDGVSLEGLLSPLSLPFQSATSPQKALALTSLGVQWAFPQDQLEVYAELVSQGGRRSLGQVLEAPLEGKGWMLGMRKAWTPSPDLHLAFGAEWTNLEANKNRLIRPPLTLYTDSLVTQGYTHRGRMLGAWIGPGSNSQIVDASIASRGMHLTLFGMRWAHDNDRYYRYFLPQPNPTNYQKHEVELILGAELKYCFSSIHVGASFAHAVLYNRFYGLRDEYTDKRNGFYIHYYFER